MDGGVSRSSAHVHRSSNWGDGRGDGVNRSGVEGRPPLTAPSATPSPSHGGIVRADASVLLTYSLQALRFLSIFGTYPFYVLLQKHRKVTQQLANVNMGDSGSGAAAWLSWQQQSRPRPYRRCTLNN
eukprot:6181022-Pleurochrysis_carterae.AAC.1